MIVAILLAKVAVAQNEVALSYHKVRGAHTAQAIFSGSFFLKQLWYSKTDYHNNLFMLRVVFLLKYLITRSPF